ALATAELVRASWAELVLPDAPAPDVIVPPPVREATARRIARAPAVADAIKPSRARSPLFVGVGLEGRYFFGAAMGMLGGRVSAEVPLVPSGSVDLSLDGGGSYGAVSDPLGQVDVGLVTGGVGASVCRAFDGLHFALGPRVELGVAYAGGRPSAPP